MLFISRACDELLEGGAVQSAACLQDRLDTPGDGGVGDAAADSCLMPANGTGVSQASLPLGRRPALQA